MQQVKMPDGTTINFPDNMSHAQIQGVLRKKYPSTKANKPGLLSRIGSGIGAAELGALKGVGEIGRGIDYLAKSGLRHIGIPVPLPGDPFDYSKPTGGVTSYLGRVEKRHPYSSLAGQFAGQVAPLIAGGGIPELIASGGEGALASLASKFTSLPGFARAAAGGAAQGAVLEPEHPGYSAALGAALGGGLGLAGKGVQSIIGRSLRPELGKKLLGAMTRTKTKLPIGAVLQSPFLKKFEENIVPTIPWSGMSELIEKTRDTLSGHAKSLLEDLRGGLEPGKIPELIRGTIQKGFKAAHALKRELYKATDEIATKKGVKVKSENYRAKLDEILSEHEEGTEENKLPNDVFEKLDRFRSKLRDKSFKEASLVHAKFNELAEKEGKELNRHLAGKYTQLKDSIHKDMEESAEAHPEVFKSWKAAQKNYAENVAPYDDPKIKTYLRRDADFDTIAQTFIKKGEYDRPHLLKKLTDKLPEKEKRALAHWYLTKSAKVDESRPALELEKAMRSYNELGEESKNLLFSPEHIKKLDDMSIITKNAPNTFFNPPTGQRNLMALLGHIALYGGSAAGAGVPLAKLIGGARAYTELSRQPALVAGAREMALKGLGKLASPATAVGNVLLNRLLKGG